MRLLLVVCGWSAAGCTLTPPDIINGWSCATQSDCVDGYLCDPVSGQCLLASETCVDQDRDGYGVGSLCQGSDCDDTSATCNVNCDSVDGDALPDCSDGCVDADGDGVGATGGLNIDCPAGSTMVDAAPSNANRCADTDQDGCDDCIYGAFNPADDGLDRDLDGLCDTGDSCVDVNHDTVCEDPNACPDQDEDGVGDGTGGNVGCAVTAVDSNDGNANVCADLDGDGCDDCSSGSYAPNHDGLDTDADGQCNTGDLDDDGDGVNDTADLAPADRHLCRDLDADGCDDCSVTGGPPNATNDGNDTDDDGLCDVNDTCTDVDADGLGNGARGNSGCAASANDSDDDDSHACADTDHDGCDDCSAGHFDPAGDGTDTDTDGLCNKGDTDDDGDTVADTDDNAATDRFRCRDADNDTCDDCAVTGGPPDPANDGTDSNNDGICDAAPEFGPFEPGMHEISLVYGGSTRRYFVYVPQGKTVNPVRAAVVALHPSDGGSDCALALSAITHPFGAWRRIADDERFLVVFPEAPDCIWNDCRSDDTLQPSRDDVSLITAVVADVASRYTLASEKFFVTGAGSGGLMALRVLYKNSALFSGYAVANTNLPALPDSGSCSYGPSGAAPILITQGSADPMMPYNGENNGCVEFPTSPGCERGTVMSAADTVENLRNIVGASATATGTADVNIDTADAGPAHLDRYEDGSEFLWVWTLTNAGHPVPSTTVQVTTGVGGPQNRDIEFARRAWDFFFATALSSNLPAVTHHLYQRNKDTGEFRIWAMHGKELVRVYNIGTIPMVWTIEGVGDWTAGGTPDDILWRHNTFAISIWNVQNYAYVASVALTDPGSSWIIGAIGDMDADGVIDDIVWRSPTTGGNGVWIMDQGTSLGSKGLDTVGEPWTIQAAGDLDGDGIRDDLFWRKMDNGANSIWLLAQPNLTITGVSLPAKADLNWNVVGCVDINRDGRDDLVWQHTPTGALAVTYVEANTISAEDPLTSYPAAWISLAY